MNSLENIKAVMKSGQEKLLYNQEELPYSLLDFWRWSVSDVLSNATRGKFAEFIVATAAKVDIELIRDEWGAFDLETPDGTKIEVKSAGYIQSWEQKKISTISFSIKLSKPWDSQIESRSIIAKRSADVYVFCLLHYLDKPTINPLNLNHWEFYVLATEELNNYKRSQHSITINSLKRLTSSVEYDKLENEIKTKSILNKKYSP